jgi:arylsulfatase A-like enzyme
MIHSMHRHAERPHTRSARTPGRRRSRPLLSAALAVTVLACSEAVSREDLEPPSAVILISLDTLRADFLGVYGQSEYASSPFLDSLADESVVFENSIVTEPWTLPSHMSLFTGLHSHHHGVWGAAPLAPGVATLASILRTQGYATRAYTDGGYLNRGWGFERGFDHYDPAPRGGLGEIVPKVIAWLEQTTIERFFLFLHTYDNHSWGRAPLYRCPPPFRGMFSNDVESELKTWPADREDFGARFVEKCTGRPVDREAREAAATSCPALSENDKRYVRATYAETVRYVDEQLKKLFEYLKREGIYDRSLIVIWSDHGEGLYDHVDLFHTEVYDHTIRSVLMVKVPGIDRGRRIESVVSAVDLLPTILELVGAPGPDALDGQSVLNHVFDDEAAREAFSVMTKAGRRLFSLRTPRHHFFWDGRRDQSYLFDLENDPGETRNLSRSGASVEPEMRNRLFAWMRQYDADRARAPGAGLTLGPAVAEELRALGYLSPGDGPTAAAEESPPDGG